MKIFFLVICTSLAITSAAQEITGSRGEPILPEKGDWGISFNAIPFMQYAGKAFYNSNTSQSVFPQGFENTLVLKKFKEDKRALRLKIRVGLSKEKIDTMVIGLGDTVAIPRVTDSKETSKRHFAFGVGFQKNHGKGKLQGYTGMELLVKFNSQTTTYTYGDGALSALVWTHTNTFGQGAGVKEEKGNETGLNASFLLGAEFFFSPKMSLSAEYAWGVNYFVIGEQTTTREYWDFAANKVKTTTKRIPKQPTVVLDTFNDAASINLSFYF